MTPLRDVLNEQTLVPVTFFLVLVPVVFWVATLSSRVETNTDTLVEQREDDRRHEERMEARLGDIADRLARIEGKLDRSRR